MNKNVILSSVFFLATVALAGVASWIDAPPAYGKTASSETVKMVAPVAQSATTSSVRGTFRTVNVQKSSTKKVEVKQPAKVCYDHEMWASGDETVRICEFR